MAAVTKLEKQFLGQLENSTVRNPQLANAVTNSDLTFSFTSGILDDSGTKPTEPFVLIIKGTQAGEFPEAIYCADPSTELSADGKTLTLASITQRGINRASSSTAPDFLSGSAANRSAHSQKSEVRVSIHALVFRMMVLAMTGDINSGGATWKVGRGTDEDIIWYAANGDANPPYFKYISASNKFVVASDGVTEIDMASGGIQTASGGVKIVGADISLDIAATNDLVKITGTELDTNLTATKTEIDQLSGTTNIAEADTFFGATDATGAEMETLTDGSDASQLHEHASNEGAINDTVNATSDTLVIPHGLGVVPRRIKIDARRTNMASVNDQIFGSSVGVFDGTNYSTVYSGNNTTTTSTNNVSTTKIIHLLFIGTGTVAQSITATAAVDATNITLTYANSDGANSYSISMLWEAFA